MENMFLMSLKGFQGNHFTSEEKKALKIWETGVLTKFYSSSSSTRTVVSWTAEDKELVKLFEQGMLSKIESTSQGPDLKDMSEKAFRIVGMDVVVLANISTWTDYAIEHKDRLKGMRPDVDMMKEHLVDGLSDFKPDVELNDKVSIFVGDITKLDLDGIVNAGNCSLLGGGGIDGAIHHAAGPDLMTECRTLSGCSMGDAKVTSGYKLPAKHIIHTVGPRLADANVLKSCYNRSIDEMLTYGMRTMAFCCIATGIYGFPNKKAVHVALKTIRERLSTLKLNHKLHTIDRIVLCLFLPVDVKLYETWMQVYFPIPESDFSLETKEDGGSAYS